MPFLAERDRRNSILTFLARAAKADSGGWTKAMPQATMKTVLCGGSFGLAKLGVC
jgi:hypothetical protein